MLSRYIDTKHMKKKFKAMSLILAVQYKKTGKGDDVTN